MFVACPHCRTEIEMTSPESEQAQCSHCGASFSPRESQTLPATVDPTAELAAQDQYRRRLGRFEVIEVLGQGAFGTVYKALDPTMDRFVAVKVSHAGALAAPQARERFLREARSAAQLRHPGIVAIHEVGEEEGVPFLVSEYVEGGTLADWLAANRPTPEQSARLTAALADALQHAHQKGVVHRDLKPANVLLASGVSKDPGSNLPGSLLTPLAKITDFGLARRDTGEVSMTVEGAILGTPAYMSPEQARGFGHTVDGRSDVYSLGVILYQMLTGELPFRGTEQMLLLQVLTEEPRSPRSLDEKVPRDLQTICLKAMAREPARRYASAGELADEVRRFLNHEAIRARPVGQFERVWRWCRRNPAVAGLSAVLLLLLASAALVASLVAVREYRLAESERSARLAVADKNEEIRRQLSRQYVANGARALEESHYSLAVLWFVKALKLDEGDSEREPIHRLRIACTLRQMPKLTGMFFHDAPVYVAHASPDGRRAVTTSYDGTARLWDLTTGEAIGKVMRHRSFVFEASFSPDGKRVATASADGSARVWDAATGEPVSPSLEHAWAVHDVRFSSDGEKLLTACGDPAGFWSPPPGVDPRDFKKLLPTERKELPYAALWDLRTGKPTPLAGLERPPLRAVFSHDERLIAACVSGGVRLFDAATGKFDGAALSSELPLAFLQFSPDGKRLAACDHMRMLYLWDVRTRKPVIGRVEEGYACWFSPDSQHLLARRVRDAATGAVQRELASLQLRPQDGQFGVETCRLLSGGPGRGIRVWDPFNEDALSPTLSGECVYNNAKLLPDGRRVLIPCEDHVARLWDLAGQAAETPPLLGGSAIRAVYSPDGKRILTGDHQGVVRLWDSRTGKPALPVLSHDDAVPGLGFSPDGKHFFTGCVGGRLRKWEVETGRPSGESIDTGLPIVGLRLTPDGRFAVTVTYDAEKQGEWITVWDLNTGRPAWPRVDNHWRGMHIQISEDGRWLAAANHQTAATRVWELATGKPVTPELKHAYWAQSPAFRSDGKRLLTGGGDRLARLWELPGGREVRALPHATTVYFACFAPDGRFATAQGNGEISLWDAEGESALALHGHRSQIEYGGFSRDGRFLLTGGMDLTARLWDGKTGEPMGPALRHLETITGAWFRPDMGQVLTGDYDRAARLWDFTPDNRPVADLWDLA